MAVLVAHMVAMPAVERIAPAGCMVAVQVVYLAMGLNSESYASYLPMGSMEGPHLTLSVCLTCAREWEYNPHVSIFAYMLLFCVDLVTDTMREGVWSEMA